LYAKGDQTVRQQVKWAAIGDVNAFFGLMLDNVANLLLVVGLLATVYKFPAAFAVRYMIPGTAIGVLLGDLAYFWMALRLARRTQRNDVTAMPLGLDTPSTFGMVFFVLGPAYQAAFARTNDAHQAAHYAWCIGMCALLYSGVFKCLCALVSGWVRRQAPRAGLLGSLAAIALVLISFLPLMEILTSPVVGFLSLALILSTLVARLAFPGRIPGALAALLAGGVMYYVLRHFGAVPTPEAPGFDPAQAWFPSEWLTAFTFPWINTLWEAAAYLPVVLPFALGTVVGGIDCTESAAAAGDEYSTGQVIAVEAVATLVAALCGGVIQTTPYIGHPAYKAMGGRSAYTLATALFVGGAGLVGYFGYLYILIPKPAAFPILIFVGLEITAQSFHAVPYRHYTAVALACVPALAFLAGNFADQVLQHFNHSVSDIKDPMLKHNLETLHMLSNGFIVTSLLWASALAAMIDRRLATAGTYYAIGAVLTFFGVIHSTLPGGAVYFPWHLEVHQQHAVYQYTAAYVLVGAMFYLWSALPGPLGSDAEGSDTHTMN
jgi:AGZA family xanthine/uracil permease-like MFS transporter